MEEDIKVLEEFIKYAKNTLNDFDYERPIEVTIWETEIQAIENLINRNRTLEKEIKLMKSVNLEENYIHKSKVREKIEEANKEIKQMEQDDIGIGFTLGKRWSDLKAKVKGWEELLEERN